VNVPPEISVVMSVYNDAAQLPRTLASILDQRDCDFEFIVIDDGSSDGSAAILDEWASRHDRMRVVHQSNSGLTRALVRGCAQARGRFIARQDAGDISLPGRLAAQAAMLRDDRALAFSGCAFNLVGPQGECLTDFFTKPSDVPQELVDREGRNVPYPHHGTVMFRKSAYETAGGYRASFYFAQDIDLWTRLIEHGSFGWTGQVLYEVRFDLDGISARHRSSQIELRRLIVEATKLRRNGESEAAVLARASEIRSAEKAEAGGREHRVQSAYFVGSCLAQRGDPRARRYLLEVVRQKPLHFKSWYKLMRSALKSWN
jgi:glycosyltransferase involved in cell wall biosynthesis